MGKGVDVSSLVNTEVNWDWRTSALSPALSALLCNNLIPPAIYNNLIPTPAIYNNLIAIPAIYHNPIATPAIYNNLIATPGSYNTGEMRGKKNQEVEVNDSGTTS